MTGFFLFRVTLGLLFGSLRWTDRQPPKRHASETLRAAVRLQAA